MAIWNNPSVTRPIRKGGLGNIEIIYSIGILDEFQDVVEQCFLCLGLMTGFAGSWRDFKVFVIETESHGSKHDVHTLLDTVLT